METNPTWKLGKAAIKTNHLGRKFATWQAVSSDGRHRTRTVILRHGRSGPELATGAEARGMALRSLQAEPNEVHMTLDGGDNEWIFD